MPYRTSSITRLNSFRNGLLLPLVSALVACGGGGGGSSGSTPPPPPPSLAAIALSPSAVTLAPGASASLTVTGTYSDGSTQTLAAAGESFTSSDDATVSVSMSGVATATGGATNGATVTIVAKD
ncbi:MAG: Ig-like domain-containing protein, partial [Steroidobacteraceae bacterium]